MSKVVITFGRYNPPHIGTEKLFDFARDLAIKKKAAFKIYASHSQDNKKNPLDYKTKIKFLKAAFPQYANNIAVSNQHTIFNILRELQKHYTYVILVVGEDRVKQFQDALKPYINTEDPAALTLHGFDVVSAGDRDPDSDDFEETASATKMRDYVKNDNYEEFKKMLPSKLDDNKSKQLFQLVKKGLSLKESINIILGDMSKLEEETVEVTPEREEHRKKFNRFKEFFIKMMDEAMMDEDNSARPDADFLKIDSKTGERKFPVRKNGKIDPVDLGHSWAALKTGVFGHEPHLGSDKNHLIQKLKNLYKAAGLENPDERNAESEKEPEVADKEEDDTEDDEKDSEIGQWVKVGNGWVVRFSVAGTDYSASFYPLDTNEEHWKFTYFKTGQRDSSDIQKFGDSKNWQTIWKHLVPIIKDFIRIFVPHTVKFIGMSSSKRPNYYKELFKLYIHNFLHSFRRLGYGTTFDSKDLDKSPSFVIKKHSKKDADEEPAEEPKKKEEE